MISTARGSARAFVVWLGTFGYLIYQAVLLCFATPLNNLFLLYVAYLGLAVWSTVTLLRAMDLPAFGTRVSATVPARVTAAAALVLVMLNAGAWLARIVPAMLSPTPTSVLDGTGLVINPVYVQDLAIWLPCWRRPRWPAGGGSPGAAHHRSDAGHVRSGEHQHLRGPVVRLARRPHLVSVVADDGTVFAVVAAVIAGFLVRFLRTIDQST